MRIQKTTVNLKARPCGRVYKGNQKSAGEHFGKDLNDRLRFRASDVLVASAMETFYGHKQFLLGGTHAENFAERTDLNIIVKHLNIVFPGEIDDVFDSSMRIRNSKGEVIRICDRRTIQQERSDYRDINGQPGTQLIECQKPCPVADAGMGTACPLGCTQEVTLSFQVAELVLSGEFRHCVLSSHSWEDETGIPSQLELLEQAYGSICRSEFEWKGLGNRIPFILSRYQVQINRPNIDTKQTINLEGRKVPVRTGGKAKSSTWAIAIRVNPQWHQAWLAWQEDKKARYFGLSTNPANLIQAGIIDAEIVESPKPPALSPAQSIEDDSWRITGYEWAVKQGLDPNTAQEIISVASSKENLYQRLRSAIAQRNQVIEAETVGG